MAQPTSKRTSGFSLVEILVVLSIMGILATMAVPALTAKSKSRRVRGTIPIGTIHSMSLVNAGQGAVTINVTIKGHNVVLGTQDGGNSLSTATYRGPNVYGICMYSPEPTLPLGSTCRMTVPFSGGVSCTSSGSGSTCTNTKKTLAPGEGMTLGFGAQKAHFDFNGERHYEYWGWAPHAVTTRSSNHAIWYEIKIDDPTGLGRLLGHIGAFEDSGNISSSLPIMADSAF